MIRGQIRVQPLQLQAKYLFGGFQCYLFEGNNNPTMHHAYRSVHLLRYLFERQATLAQQQRFGLPSP
jgi:hypothetical protein